MSLMVCVHAPQISPHQGKVSPTFSKATFVGYEKGKFYKKSK